MLDALVASVALVLTWFLSPDKVGSVLALIGIWQPVLIAVIVSIAAEDVALSKAGAEKYKADSDVVAAKAYQADINPNPSTAPVVKIDIGEPVSLAVSGDEKPQG